MVSVLRNVSRWQLVVAGLSCLLGLVALVELTGEISPDDSIPVLDRRISSRVAELRGERLTDIVQAITTLADTEVIVMVAVVAVVGALVRNGVSLPMAVLGSVLATAVLVFTMKGVIGRERPLPPINLHPISNAAYPSGHSAHAVGSWGAFIWMLATGRSHLAKATGAVVALAIALSVGLSRVYLGVHWLSDVIAGWAVGGVCLSTSILARSVVRAWQAPAETD